MLASLVAACSEVVVLALVAHVAAAISGDTRVSSIGLGPLEVDASITLLLAIAAAMAVVRLGAQLVVAFLPARMTTEVQSKLRSELVNAFTEASWSVQSEEHDGRLQELVGSQATTAGTAVGGVTVVLAAGFMFVTLTISAVAFNPLVALLVMGTALLLFAALRPMSRRVRLHARERSSAGIDMAVGVSEAVRLAQDVHVFGARYALRGRISALVDVFESHYLRTLALSRAVPALYQSGVIILLVAGITVVYVVGSSHVAALGTVVLIFIRAAAYGQQVQTAYQKLGESLPYVDRVRDAIERYRASKQPRGTYSPERIGDLAFRNVSFEYRSGIRALDDVSFTVQAGQAVGIVGPSGAGKSTLVQLLLRLRDPTEGAYLVNDGVPAADVDSPTWTAKVAYVSQEPQLLDGTVSDNIRFFRDAVTDAAVERAARLAHVHDDIQSWESGYHTIIGQRVSAVSGGQRQRIALARALAGDPDLLILDEPTSALDPQSEAMVQASLKSIKGSMTLFVVAHRLSTLHFCDLIIVMRDGRVDAFDRASVLYDTNLFYRHAVDLARTARSS